MILHVAENGPIIAPFIELINKEFSEERHQFWLFGSKKKENSIRNSKNIFHCNGSVLNKIYGFIFLIVKLHTAKKVILHGLFMPYVLLALSICPWNLRKCYWVLWGGDYLYRKVQKRDLKFYIKEPFRKFVMKRIGHLVTYIPESVDIVREWFGNKGEWHECLCYPSNVFYNDGILRKSPSTGGQKVLVGSSATRTNQYDEAFRIISPYMNDRVVIYAQLSYGDKKYANEVIDLGKETFGDQFFPLTEFLTRVDYQKFINDIDVVFFNHNRHQAMGTIIKILGLGKTLYINSDIASWSFLKNKGIDVFDISKFEGLEKKANAEKNRQIIEKYFSQDHLILQWRAVFDQ
ncbi:TDP-N-acetylfucosamine:lipid II N-acetylfucosaminyltransferase [Marinobacter salarius]|uniref:TDP-N-acetylfucosamine:lipid II N-acetylfucosaminyltransferase n=1 Tax=Marinobacter salarius TaxID=1420917 RepID=UPI003D0F9187